MSEEAVPPYRSAYDDLRYVPAVAATTSPYRRRPTLVEKLILNSTFGKLGSRFNSGGIVESTLPVCRDYPQQPNQEKPMNECQTPKPAYKPGDRVLYETREDRGPAGVVQTSTELVFIAFDPEQPNVVLVRDVGNLNAPIRGVHSSYIKAVPPKPKHKVLELFARRNATKADLAVIEHVSDLDRFTDIPLRIIAARVTGDGLLQVKVDMDSAVEHEAIIAAHRNPCVDFTSKKANLFPYPSTTN